MTRKLEITEGRSGDCLAVLREAPQGLTAAQVADRLGVSRNAVHGPMIDLLAARLIRRTSTHPAVWRVRELVTPAPDPFADPAHPFHGATDLVGDAVLRQLPKVPRDEQIEAAAHAAELAFCREEGYTRYGLPDLWDKVAEAAVEAAEAWQRRRDLEHEQKGEAG